ncbi:MAG: mechanosensitive ion channel family protein, partial [Rariglobus sp.]
TASTSSTTGTEQSVMTTNAAAAVASGAVDQRVPDFVEHLVDSILDLFDVRTSSNSWQHYAIAGVILVGFYLLRRVVTMWLFGFLKKFAARTRTTFDDKLFPALETPVATFIALLGLFTALKVLKLSVTTDEALRVAMTMAFSLCFFWALLRTLSAFLDHLQEVAKEKKAGVAAFMPWIKKTLITVFTIFAVLMVAQSMGANVKAFLAGLGIGGLAFALAAQDTIANLFGSVVVAIDQPFRLGDAVKIGNNEGTVEDIGLRSTKLRRPDRSLAILPNKGVAAEPIINNSRINARRLEQVIGITYDATADQISALVEEIRGLILAEEEVDKSSVMVFFRDLNTSSLDIWVVYMTKTPDFQSFMRLRQRLNLAFMRAISARGLSFAFPTQTLDLGVSAAKLFGSDKISSATQTKQPGSSASA